MTLSKLPKKPIKPGSPNEKDVNLLRKVKGEELDPYEHAFKWGKDVPGYIKTIFRLRESDYVDLVIKARHDGLNKMKLIFYLVQYYLKNDSRIREIIQEILEAQTFRGKRRRKYVERFIQKGKETEIMFGLDNEEIDSIFDILTEEEEEIIDEHV